MEHYYTKPAKGVQRIKVLLKGHNQFCGVMHTRTPFSSEHRFSQKVWL